MRLAADRVRVTVPATSANLGPGFDALGIALDLTDVLEVRAVGSDETVVEVTGEGAGEVPSDERHLVARALRAALDLAGAPQTGLRLTCRNRIPHGRGLGSSAAAVVAGIAAARALIADPEALDDAAALRLATEFEGHPDNAAPALLGGATIAWMGADGARASRIEVHPDLRVAVAVPTARLATSRARGALPRSVPHADAAFTAGRAALLVQALTGRPELLLEATEDRLHQRYRAEVMPSSLALVDALRGRGVAAAVSGAGPTVLVLHARAQAARVDVALSESLTALADASARWEVLRPAVHGAGVRAVRIEA